MKSQSHRSTLAKIFLIVLAITVGGVLQAAPEDQEKDSGRIAVQGKGI